MVISCVAYGCNNEQDKRKIPFHTLMEYEACEKLYRDIMEQLTIRQKFSRTTDKYSQLSANIRLRLKQYKNELSQLNQKLETIAKSENVTPAESERRTRQIEILHSKGIYMQKIFDEQVATKLIEDRAQLIGGSEWANEGPSNSNNTNASVDDLRTQQKQMLGEQDRGLENLSQIISRQKDIAHTISNEVDYHNEILDDLGTHIDRTDQRVRTETQHISVVDNKDNTCIYWVIIILLFISITVVAII